MRSGARLEAITLSAELAPRADRPPARWEDLLEVVEHDQHLLAAHMIETRVSGTSEPESWTRGCGAIVDGTSSGSLIGASGTKTCRR